MSPLEPPTLPPSLFTPPGSVTPEKTKRENDNYIEDKPIFIQKEELNKVNIDKSLEMKISKNIDRIAFLNPEQKEKFLKKILSTYQAKYLQE